MKFKITSLVLVMLLFSVITAQDATDSADKSIDTASVAEVKNDSSIASIEDKNVENEPADSISNDSVSSESTNLEVVDKDTGSSDPEIIEDENEIAEDDSLKQPSEFGKISVTAKPESTLLYFDEKLIGYTPVTLDSILPGKAYSQTKKSGYYVKKASLNVKAGSNADLDFELLKPSTLKISTIPEKAVVSLNGKMVGQTPFASSKLKPGKYEISVQSSGFEAQDTTLNLLNGSVDSLFFSFGESVDSISDSDEQGAEGEPQEKTRIEKVLNKVAIGIFAAFTALILLIELNHNNE